MQISFGGGGGGGRGTAGRLFLFCKFISTCKSLLFKSVPSRLCEAAMEQSTRITKTELNKNIQDVPGGMCQTSEKVFLMLKYTDITQNIFVQSWTVTEIKAREKCGLLAVPRTVPGSRDVIPIRCAMSVLVYSGLERVPCCDCTSKVLGNPKDNYDVSASVFVVQFDGFMSLTS